MAAVLSDLLVAHARVPLGTQRVAGAHALLRQVLADLLGGEERAVVRRCATCGGPHGKPVLDPTGPHVSLTTAPGIAVVAVTGAGPVGIDVEHLVATDFDGFGSVALGPGELDGDPAHRARVWTRKEAALKATGEGLARDPRSVDVRGERALGALLLDVDVGPGLACAAAVLAADTPALRVEERALSR